MRVSTGAARGVARIFEWGGTSTEGARSEAPKVPRGLGCGEGVKNFDYLTLKWCILVRI